MCLIDDCVNRDVPLLDFTLTELHAEHDLLLEKKGKATSVFSGEYYNRNISSWEPMVEPWRYVGARIVLRKLVQFVKSVF